MLSLVFSKEVSTRRRAPPMASEVLALPSNPPNPTPLALTLSDRGCCCLCRPAGTVVRRLCLHWPWQPPSVSANVPRQIHLEATDVLIRCSLPWRIPVLCCSHTSLPPAVLNLTSALVSLVPPQLIVRTQPPHASVSPQTAHCSTSLVPPQLIVRTQLASQPHRLPHSTDIPRQVFGSHRWHGHYLNIYWTSVHSHRQLDWLSVSSRSHIYPPRSFCTPKYFSHTKAPTTIYKSSIFPIKFILFPRSHSGKNLFSVRR